MCVRVVVVATECMWERESAMQQQPKKIFYPFLEGEKKERKSFSSKKIVLCKKKSKILREIIPESRTPMKGILLIENFFLLLLLFPIFSGKPGRKGRRRKSCTGGKNAK